MTLRTRLAALSTALLAAVLAVSGIALERIVARDVERSLEERVRQRARAPLPPTGERTAAGIAAAAESPSAQPWDAPPPPPPPPPRDGDATPPPGEEPPPPPPPASDEAPSARRVLPPELDGTFVAVMHFRMPGPDGVGAPVLLAEATTGGARVTEAEARAALLPARRDPFGVVGSDGTPWIVVQDLAVPQSPDRGPPGPPGRGPPDSRRPPPGPPRRPPTPIVSVAFLDPGPARDQHRAFVFRLAGIGLASLFVGGFLAWGLAGRMLRPVRDAARAAEAIVRPEQRLPAPQGPDELGRLVGVLNGMLGRLEAASNRERLFLATASHELRRPLTALLGELELASAPGRGPDELRSALALAREDARSMGRLVDDLLHHARAQAGTLRLVEGETYLPDLVTDAVDRSRRSVPHPVVIDVGEVPAVLLRADPDLLRQALENLCVNAAVHGGTGVRVSVHGERSADAVLLHVDDDGPGVAADERETIFEPFGRGDRTRSVPGFGLGLAIAQDAVRAHGGDLAMVSPCPGRPEGRPGARFTLRIPAVRVLPRA